MIILNSTAGNGNETSNSNYRDISSPMNRKEKTRVF
jgi:hypothetical protein